MNKRVVFLFSIIGTSVVAFFVWQYSVAKLDPIQYEKQFKIAGQALLEGDNNTAITIFNQLVQSNDQYPALFFNLGRAYSNIKEYEKAAQAFERCVTFNFNFKHLAHFNCGLAYFNSNNEAQALEE